MTANLPATVVEPVPLAVREGDYLREYLERIRFCPNCGARAEVYDEKRGFDKDSGLPVTRLNVRCTRLDGASPLRFAVAVFSGSSARCDDAVAEAVRSAVGFRQP